MLIHTKGIDFLQTSFYNAFIRELKVLWKDFRLFMLFCLCYIVLSNGMFYFINKVPFQECLTILNVCSKSTCFSSVNIEIFQQLYIYLIFILSLLVSKIVLSKVLNNLKEKHVFRGMLRILPNSTFCEFS